MFLQMLNNMENLHFEVHSWNIKGIFSIESVLYDLKDTFNASS